MQRRQPACDQTQTQSSSCDSQSPLLSFNVHVASSFTKKDIRLSPSHFLSCFSDITPSECNSCTCRSADNSVNGGGDTKGDWFFPCCDLWSAEEYKLGTTCEENGMLNWKFVAIVGS